MHANWVVRWKVFLIRSSFNHPKSGLRMLKSCLESFNSVGLPGGRAEGAVGVACPSGLASLPESTSLGVKMGSFVVVGEPGVDVPGFSEEF